MTITVAFSEPLDAADFDVMAGNGRTIRGQLPPAILFDRSVDGNKVTLVSKPLKYWPAQIAWQATVVRKSDNASWLAAEGSLRVEPTLPQESEDGGPFDGDTPETGFYDADENPATVDLRAEARDGVVYFTQVTDSALSKAVDELKDEVAAIADDVEAVKEDMDGKYDKVGGTIKGSAYVGQGGASVVYPVTYVDLPEGWSDTEGFGLHIGLGGTTMDGPTLQGLADAAAVCDKVNSYYRTLWIKPFAYPVSDSRIAITAGVALPHIVKYTIVTFWVERMEIGSRVRYIQHTIRAYNVGDDIAPSTTACGASSTITEGGVIRDSILKVRLLEGETVLFEREFDTSANYRYISQVMGIVGGEMGVAYYDITPYGMVGASTGIAYAVSAGSRSNNWVLEVTRWSITGTPSVSTYELGTLTQGKGNDKDVPTAYALKLNGLDVLTTGSPQFSRQQALVAGHETRVAALEASTGPSAPETSLPADLKLKHGHLYLLDCTDGLDLSTIEVQTYASFKLWLDCSQAGDVQFPSFWHIVDGLEPGYDGAGRYMYDAVNNGSVVLLVHVAHYYDA